MSVSAGLAHEGFRPLAFAFAPFASMRCYEQVRTDICYSKLPVVIIGNGAGYSNGASGCTHCGLEDSALMVACDNMTVLEPGDPFQIAKLPSCANARRISGWKMMKSPIGSQVRIQFSRNVITSR